MFYRIRSGEPFTIIVFSYLLRVHWRYRTRKWLLHHYLLSADHAANFMLLLHDEKVQGWSYPEEVRRWAYDTLEELEKSDNRERYIPANEWPHYLYARDDFRRPTGC